MKLRFLTGGIIALHGLLHIVFIEKYIDFVYDNFYQLFPSETLLTVCTSIFPFLEFFVGLLIAFNLGKNGAMLSAFLVSLIMSAFLIADGLYIRLVYHTLVIILLMLLYLQSTKPNRRKFILKS
ncbi:MAG: hypothetical protein JKY22_07875 [Flavobacteriaceae bacterium]|nr:hypothetical protein [Flavobacteriaceae bacterium]